MLQFIYILLFTIIAILVVSNLIRSLITLSAETQKLHPPRYNGSISSRGTAKRQVHPELLDEQGRVIEEPLLVMRSVSVDDARSRLDALYDASPSQKIEPDE
ncbi:MAG: DUF2973 domain-containing protein [Cyanobacteria bacterium J06621_8]